MPRYHFHINDAMDSVGIELSDVGVAKCEAVKLAGAVICEECADSFWPAAEWTMTVTNGDYLMLFQLVLIGADAPVSQKSNPFPLSQRPSRTDSP